MSYPQGYNPFPLSPKMKLPVWAEPWVLAALCVSREVSGFITRTTSIGLLGSGIRTHHLSWSQEAGIGGTTVFPALNKGGLTREVNLVNMAAAG